MFRHNLLITYRSFLRNKSSFLINLTGLSTGLACALLIYLWVGDELSVDKFHEKDSQLYQVMHNRQHPNDILTLDHTPSPLAKALVEEMPEVEYAASVNTFFDWFTGPGVISYEDNHIKAKGIFASKDYFDVFSYKLIQGNKDLVLADKKGIVVSEGLAKKLFNTTENIIGKTLEWDHRMQLEGPFYISGIVENPPSSSTSQFDVIFNYEMLLEGDRYADQWNGSYAETYLILKNNINIDQFNEKITDFLRSKHPTNDKSSLFIQQYSKKYLYGQYDNGVQVGGRIAYVKLFSIVALFVLVIACINFMNLSTAQASRKMKEIGVKKAVGANGKALVMQFLGESILMAFISLIAAILLVILLLPQFNEITGKYLYLNIGISDILIVVGIVLFTGLVSGSYPAFYLSGFNPVTVLKGAKLKASSGEQWVRKGLVILQFSISIVFIVGFLVVNKQIEFIQTKNLGYNRDHIISFAREGRYDKDPEVFLSALKNIPGVVNVSSMPGSILDGSNQQGGYSWRGQESDKDYIFKSPTIGYDVIETLGMEIVEGRSFSRDFNDDDSKIILNESAVKMMELEDPIGKIIKHGEEEQQIIGVVKDFQYGSIHHEVEPLIFRFRNARAGRNTMVKIKAGTERVTIEQIESLYKEFHPKYPFEFTFMDDDYQALYDSENRVAVLSKYFTVIAIIISCLGLFGLATFTAERRLKEIGIRKILGSTELGIVYLLSSDFTKMVLIAIMIALPVSYLLAKNWLEGFAYRIDLAWWFFVGAGLIALLIAWFTVGLQTIKAARINPVECLKDE